MIKRYCDRCGREITDDNKPKPMEGVGPIGGAARPGRLIGQVTWPSGGGTCTDDPHVLEVECTTVYDGTSNIGDFCKYCIIDAVKAADDRVAGDPLIDSLFIALRAAQNNTDFMARIRERVEKDAPILRRLFEAGD